MLYVYVPDYLLYQRIAFLILSLLLLTIIYTFWWTIYMWMQYIFLSRKEKIVHDALHQTQYKEYMNHIETLSNVSWNTLVDYSMEVLSEIWYLDTYNRSQYKKVIWLSDQEIQHITTSFYKGLPIDKNILTSIKIKLSKIVKKYYTSLQK